jgi:BTB/POZ domain
MPHANLRLLASGKSSDFTIICQGVKFKVHQAIICPESSFFRAACTNNLKVRRHLESSRATANHMRHKATLSLPEEDPEIFARVLLWLYTRDVYRPSIEEEIEKTLVTLVPGGPITERSEFETSVLVYFCADRQGIESVKQDLARKLGSLIYWFKEEDMDGDFAAFVEKVYNDIPAKDDPLRTTVTVNTLIRLWCLSLLRAQDISDDSGDDSDGDSDGDSDKDAQKRIQALIRANEPSALEIAIELISTFNGWV